ncbi:hypothetical protein Salat_2356500 [Sesamum alatum]|uniref:Uncharacterized protein n=1 Tax=Sesamum alatum TaxID=300844 RepID=A0AAE2CER1_9LAMI|nr:hypothetical protein Salat_2356500 [Sesamum alatum]
MSLHLGNLSSHTRRDDLERVFRRFGRCTIQVKDNYGFVVYDYPASAERALKTLQGKRICEEAITLSWSNRQPRAMNRFARGGKAYGPTNRKYSVKENVDWRSALNDPQDYKINSKQADVEGRKFGSSDLLDESTSYHPDDSRGYAVEDRPSSNDRYRLGGAGNNNLEDDRWGEQVVDPSSENCLDIGMEFDRYEPHRGDEKQGSDEHHGLSPLAGSPSARNPQERKGVGYNDNLRISTKSQRTCYACGEVGHKMHKCPYDLKGQTSRSQGRLRPGADSVPMRHHESKRKPFTSHDHRALLGRGGFSPQRVATRGRRKDFSDKKRYRKDYEVQDKNVKRTRGPSSTSFHSDCTLSRSQSPSRSLEFLSQSPSNSKSKSTTLKKDSRSSSKSGTSCHSGSKHVKSHSASWSMSGTVSSLPIEPYRHSPLSPNQRQTDSKDPMVNVVGLANHQDLFEGITMSRSGASVSTTEHITVPTENECGTGPSKLEEEEEMIKDLAAKDDEHNNSVSRGSCKVLASYLPHSDDGAQTADYMSQHTVEGMRDSENDAVAGEDTLAPKSDVCLRSKATNSLSMSLDEMCMVLKHYGLRYPMETEKNLPVEIYFGSARSWPWEMIYYRRLKKGPISAQNYARRISQNEEFGIVDKYIRGSSGWSELN